MQLHVLKKGLVAPHVDLAVLVSGVDLIAFLIVEEGSHVLERHPVTRLLRLDPRHAGAVENVGDVDRAEVAAVVLLAVADDQILLRSNVDVVCVAIGVPQRVVIECSHLFSCVAESGEAGG